MNYSVYRFTLNMHTHRSQASVSAVYGDTAVRLLINLTDGGMPYLIGDGCTAVLSGTKADGNKLWDRCVIINNGATIQYDFTEQTSNCAGVANCEITLYDAEGKIVTAPKFTIVIDEREVKDDDIPISETETALLDKIAIDETARVAAEEKRAKDFDELLDWVTEEEFARSGAESDRVNAETNRNKNFNAFIAKVDDAETERANAEIARVKAEEDRVTADATRNEFINTIMRGIEDAEDDRVFAEECRVSAETSRADAETARADAETARAEAEEGRVQADIERQQTLDNLQNSLTVVGANVATNTSEIKTLDEKYETAVEGIAGDVSVLKNKTTFLHTNRTRITGIKLTEDITNYKYTFQLRGKKIKDNNGVLSEGEVENIGDSVTIDLPLESVVTNGTYDDATGKVILTLHNDKKVDIPVSSLINGLVSAKTLDYEIGKIDVEFAEHIALITEIGNTVTTHDTRLTNAETKLTDHGTRIALAETNLTVHGARITNAESKLTEHTNSILGHGTRLTKAETQLTNHGTRISSAETKLTDHGTRISKAESDITKAQEDIGNLSKTKLDDIDVTDYSYDDEHVYSTYFDKDTEKIKHSLIMVQSEAVANTVVQRTYNGTVRVRTADRDGDAVQFKQFKDATAPIPEHTSKISDHEKRIENLENTLLTFGEDDSVAYVKSAPAGSAPNVMLNSVGGRSKKSKNLLPYMKTGIRVMAAGEAKYHYIYPGEQKELINGCTVTFNNDGSIRLFASETTTTTRVDFLYGNGGIKVEQDGVASYVPNGGLQLSGVYTFSANPSSDIQIASAAHKFDSSNASGFSSPIASGNNSFTMDCTDVECNNVQLVCIQLSTGTTIDTTVSPMLNEGDTAQPFEINEGITKSAVTDVTYAECGKNLFDKSQIFPETEGQIVQIPTGLRVDGYNQYTTLTPEQFLAMTGLKEGDTFTYRTIGKLVSGTWESSTSTGCFMFATKGSQPHLIFGGKLTEGESSAIRTIPEQFNSNTHRSMSVFGSSTGVIDITEITIAKGEVALPYADTLSSFPIPSEILALPDYGKEFTYIDFDRKVFVNAGHDVTFDGSEAWAIDASGPYIYNKVTYKGHPAPDASNITRATVCDRFRDRDTAAVPPETIYTTMANQSIYLNTKVATTADQWRAYLAANPLTVRYRVAEPVETDISEYLTGYDKYKMLKVGSGDIVFKNYHKNEVPSTITSLGRF